MRSVRISVLALGLLTVFVPAASAVTASVSGGVLTVTGDPGPNNIVVSVAGPNLHVAGADTPGSGCSGGGGSVDCPAAGVASVNATLAGALDRWDSTGINLPTTVDLGASDPSAFPGQGARTGDGADLIVGGPDVESDIDAAGGADTIRLLGGADGTFPGFAFTGGLESVTGGPGNDTIDMGDGNDGGTGSASIDGGPGDDMIDLGPGNDRNVVEFFDGNDTVLGGPGDDGAQSGLNAGIGNDTIDGGPGNDSALIGGAGTDVIRGGPDEDSLSTEIDGASETIEGGTGDDVFAIAYFGTPTAEAPAGDTLSGGSGRDSIAAGTAPTNNPPPSVHFSADGVADDGYDDAPRTANIGTDVEILIGSVNGDTLLGGASSSDLRGGKGDDQLTGGTGPNRLDGGDGGDTLNGGPTDDVLIGGLGADALSGNDGNDMLTGSSGADTINGGAGRDTGDWSAATSPVSLTPGGSTPDGEIGEGDALGGDVEDLIGGPFNDSMTGAPGPSMLSSGAGDDTITVTDGAADVVLCGAGDDGVDADTDDSVELTGNERCERVTKPPVVVTPPPVVEPPVVATPDPLPTLGLSGKVDKKGRQKIQIACSAAAAAACSGDVRLVDKSDEPISHKAAFNVASGATTTVPVQLDDDAVKTLKKKHKLSARILAEVAGADDSFRRAVADVKLKQ